MHPNQAHVLIIEDNASNLMIINDLLRLAGVQHIYSRAMGWQGLKLAQSLERVDLILLDIQIPYEDGYVILKQIRALPALKDTPVVAVTANTNPEDEARVRAAGFDGFIGKPINFQRFPEQIRALLQGEAVWSPD
jgi:two-component system, cell cycle response regulator DivK